MPGDETAVGSELLPRTWNQDQTGYVLRYVNRSDPNNPRKLVMKAIPNNQTHLTSFYQDPGQHTAELNLNSSRFFSKQYRDYDKYVPFLFAVNPNFDIPNVPSQSVCERIQPYRSEEAV